MSVKSGKVCQNSKIYRGLLHLNKNLALRKLNNEGETNMLLRFLTVKLEKKWSDIFLLIKVFHIDFSPSQIFKQSEKAQHST